MFRSSTAMKLRESPHFSWSTHHQAPPCGQAIPVASSSMASRVRWSTPRAGRPQPWGDGAGIDPIPVGYEWDLFWILMDINGYKWDFGY